MKTYTNPQFPGKTFRRLEVGEEIQDGDLMNAKIHRQDSGWMGAYAHVGATTKHGDLLYFYREISTTDRADLLLARINEVIQKLDAVLAKLND